MSKILGVNHEGKEVKAYTVKLDCEYLLYGKQVKKRAIYEIQTTSREMATRLAVEKAKSQLKEFSYIKNVLINVAGRSKNESVSI